MDINELKATLEALLYASPQPIELNKVSCLLNINTEDVLKGFAELGQDCKSKQRGIELIQKGTTFCFITKKAFGQTVSLYLSSRKANLSNAAMEVLSIAAYNQPVTKTYISQIRGVASSEIIETLVEKGLLEEDGKIDLPGKPMGYITTDKFLTVFNLNSLADLPQAEILAEDPPEDLPQIV